MYFWTDELRKSWLGKWLKSPVSEDPATSNMVNGPKYCSKMKDNALTIFIDPCEDTSGWKSLSEGYAESSDCFLTHCLVITSILFLIETIYSKIFRCNYIRNEKYFLNFSLNFFNLNLVLNIFKKQMTLIADVFLKLGTPKEVVR